MKKFLRLSFLFILLFSIVLLRVNALTKWKFEDWQAGVDYGSKSKVSSNITNLKGEEKESDGMKVGPFNKASKAKLSDGIKEEVYVGLNLNNYQNSELFELSIALNELDSGVSKYLTEAVVMTQKSDNKFVITAGWAKDKKQIATIDKDGVYTYRWEFKKDSGKIKVKFTVLDYDKELGTTDFVELDVDATRASDVRYLWACNIKASYGVDIYTDLPPKDVENPNTKDINLLYLIGLIIISLGFIFIIRRKVN